MMFLVLKLSCLVILREVQMKELASRQDTIRNSFLDGTREIREIEDNQTRRTSQFPPVQTLSERIEQEVKSLRVGIHEMRQELHAEISSREDSCSVIRSTLDTERKTRVEVTDKNFQLHEDLEIRMERALRAMLHDERVTREDAFTLLDQRMSSLTQELNFEKAKIAAQGRDLSQSITQLKDAILSESNARRDELDAALKSFEQVVGEASLKEEASTRELGLQICHDELTEARSLLSKEAACREEMEAKLLRRLDEERSTVEESLLKLQTAATTAEVSGLTLPKVRAMIDEECQGRQQGLQQLEDGALLQKNEGFLAEERSLREEQYHLLGGRLSQIHGDLEDVRHRAREALGRCEEIRTLQDAMSSAKADRQAEVSSTQLSLKELACRIDQVQQAGDARERLAAKQFSELQKSLDEEAHQRVSAHEELARKQVANMETMPGALAAERAQTEESLARLEEALRQEHAEERRLEQHSNVALEVSKVAEALAEETRERLKDQKALQNDVKRLEDEASGVVQLRRQAEEGLREQISLTLKRLDQAQEMLLKQETMTVMIILTRASMVFICEDSEIKASVADLRSSVSAEASARQELKQDVMLKEEFMSAASKSSQRAAAKVLEELRGALRDEAQEREELRSRLEQHLSHSREAFDEMKLRCEKREAELADGVREAAEELRSSKAKQLGLEEGLDELRSALAAAGSERRNAFEGVVARLQHLEASVGDEVAAREEEQRRVLREVSCVLGKLQEEKAIREEAIANITQSMAEQAALLEDALHKEAKAREASVAQAVAHLQKDLKTEGATREEMLRSTATKLHQLSSELQQEREDRSRLLRDVSASLAKLQRMQAEEEDTRTQENERLSGALESMHEAARSLKQSCEETRQRGQEATDQLRSLISRESTARQSKLEAVDIVVRDLRSLIGGETQQREAAVKHLTAELATEVQVREEATGRDRRAMEEDVARAIREHRQSREEEERKLQERVLEVSARLAEEREQRLEQLRSQRLKELKEELLGHRKASQQSSEKIHAHLQRLDQTHGSKAQELDSRLSQLSQSCEELKQDLLTETQRNDNACRLIESQALEVAAGLRAEASKRQTQLENVSGQLEAKAQQLAEQVNGERAKREAQQVQQDKQFKALMERQKEKLAESCIEQLAQLKEQLAEEGARRDHDISQRQLNLQQLRANRTAREQHLSLEAGLQGPMKDLQREVLLREEVLKRSEQKLREEAKQLAAGGQQLTQKLQEQLHNLEETSRQRLAEEAKRSKASLEKVSAQMSALELARSLAQLERRQGLEEAQRQQGAISLQRALDALRDDLLGEVKERRQQGVAATQEVQSLIRSWQLREDKSEAGHQQLLAELTDLRERISREVRAREAALLQLEPRLSQQRAESTGYVKALPAPSAISSERWRQAEEDLEKTKSSLASLKTEAVTQSSAIHGMTEQYESVRVALGAMQSGLLEVQQKQLKTTEVESLVTQARQEHAEMQQNAWDESLERKAENHQLSTQLLEHSERLEWAEQQRLKAEKWGLLSQDLLETKTELKREIREREEGQSQASLQLREEIGKREEAFEREARLRLDGEERVEQKLQAAVREERRQRVQSELRFEGEDKGSGTLINVSAMEDPFEQGRVRQQLLDLQARVASSEARQKTVEERTVSMLDAIMNGLMSNEA
eukprot:g1189.t1